MLPLCLTVPLWCTCLLFMRGTAGPIHVLFALFTSGAAQTPTCNVSTRQSIRDTYEPLRSPISYIQMTALIRLRAVC